MTRKEQKETRKKTILFTALELFVKNGYFDTKITDIAAASSMSTGLLFHYFESKEALLVELVKMGAAATSSVKKKEDVDPATFFDNYLEEIFTYAKEAPWVFNMFVLMSQARRAGMPEEARQIALSVNQIDYCAKIIELGQKKESSERETPDCSQDISGSRYRASWKRWLLIQLFQPLIRNGLLPF